MKRWLKILLILLLAVFIILGATFLKINSIARSQLNLALENSFANGGSVDDIDIDLISGELSVSSLVINQPSGYDGSQPLSLQEFTLNINLHSLLSNEISIEELTLSDAILTLVRDKDGNISFNQLLQPTDKTQNSAEAKNSTQSIPVVRIESLALNNIAINIIDNLAGEQWEAKLHLDLVVKNLLLSDVFNQDILVDEISLAISNISVDQPAGFGDAPLLTIDAIDISTAGVKLDSSPITISNLQIDSLIFAGEHNDAGELNLQKLLSAWQSKADPKKQPEKDVTADTTLPTIIFEHIKLGNSAITYQDDIQGKKAAPFSFINIGVEATHLSLFDSDTAATPASVLVHLEVEQPNGFPNALLGGFATVGSLGEGIPLINTQVRLVGLKFDTLGTAVSRKVRTAMGANGLDIGAVLALDTDTINLQAEILTDKNIRYHAFKVQGDIDAPEVKIHKVMAGFDRVSNGLLNLSKDGLSAGINIAGGGFSIIKQLSTNVMMFGASTGKSVLNVGAGVVTLDPQRLSDGIGNIARSTTKTTSNSISGVGKTTRNSFKNSIHGLTGNTTLDTWAKNIPERYQSEIQQAKINLDNMPYPPVTE